MVDLDSLAPARIRKIRRVEYDRMVDIGLFEGERVELLAGVLVEMSPQKARHAEAVRRLNLAFIPLDQQGRATVCIQLPLAISEDSEPEPDLAVVPHGDYSAAHPEVALLVVEVAESSVNKDQRIKAPLYAAAGVPEYWIVNIPDRAVEVYRDPSASGYGSRTVYGEADRVSPLRFPDLVVAVGALLPGRPR